MLDDILASDFTKEANIIRVSPSLANSLSTRLLSTKRNRISLAKQCRHWETFIGNRPRP
jgi:hypothetical protein